MSGGAARGSSGGASEEAARSRGALGAAIAARRQRRRAEAALAAVFGAWGYEEVALPLLTPVDGDEAWGQYRVIDQDGALLALRPDMTGPIARLCALGDAGGPRPRRLFYLATLFRRGDASGAAGPREVPQAGVELIGAAGALADAEVLALCAEALRAAGAGVFRLAVGHLGLLRRLLGPYADEGCAALLRRDFVALAEVLRGRPELLAAVTWRGSAADVLAGRAPWEDRDLAATLELVCEAGLGEQVAVEVGLVRPGGYYTGLVFEVSAPGRARPLGGGGRYDGLAGEPATGFALDLEELAGALPGAAAPPVARDAAVTLLVAEPGAAARAWREADALRRAGGRVVVDGRPAAEAAAYAREIGCERVLVVRAAGGVAPWPA